MSTEKDAMALADRLREAARNPYGAVRDLQARARIAAEAADTIEALIDRATRAEAELAAVREDAERYRWLVESNWPEIFYYHDGEHHKHYHDSRSAVAQLSAAIDAARDGE